MTHTIDLSPEIEAFLQEEAARQRQTPEEYLRAAVENLLKPTGRVGRSWSEIEGAAVFPLVGEDAQAWVTRTRREGDDRRERLLRPETSPSVEAGE